MNKPKKNSAKAKAETTAHKDIPTPYKPLAFFTVGALDGKTKFNFASNFFK